MPRDVQTYWVTRIFSNPARVHIHQPAQFTASWHIPVLRRENERERETGIAMTETKTEVFCALKISASFSLCIWHRFGSSKRRHHAVILCWQLSLPPYGFYFLFWRRTSCLRSMFRCDFHILHDSKWPLVRISRMSNYVISKWVLTPAGTFSPHRHAECGEESEARPSGCGFRHRFIWNKQKIYIF